MYMADSQRERRRGGLCKTRRNLCQTESGTERSWIWSDFSQHQYQTPATVTPLSERRAQCRVAEFNLRSDHGT